ncbi:MAG: hypothetical protein M5U29_13985 [Anaerolineae bacterium]|nr:hypothetical protein [Anaerolineae bacterium]
MTASDHVEVTENDTGDAEVTLYCTVHPTVATHLRCNRCGRPMCTRCAVKTPVGYRCRECVRAQQDKFFDAQMLDYLIAGAVSLTISFFAALVVARLGWFLFAFFLAPAAGGLIGRVVWRLTGKRRGRYTAIVVGANVVVGALLFLPGNPLAIGIYLFMATGAAVAQFRLFL